jgi:ATP-binding protein involved in chromosome partitioning
MLDADIYGPSQPMMMGIEGRPESERRQDHGAAGEHGVQVMSIGFLVDRGRGHDLARPDGHQALEQLLRQTNWPISTT